MLAASAAGRPSGAPITPVGSVEEALCAGTNAVVVYVALAGENEPEMISGLSRVAETCEVKGMPLIAETEYPNAHQSLDSILETLGPEYPTRNARLCAELGADVVKAIWSGDARSFEESIRACGKPVVLAGGSRISDLQLLTRMAEARKAGAVGCFVGRNVFEHAARQAMTAAISRIFRDGWTVG
jgi:fructose-bisphosphate aldolase / 2-amino-3,7-dideoxy-D-threo-hept-6-ulosonate synthase